MDDFFASAVQLNTWRRIDDSKSKYLFPNWGVTCLDSGGCWLRFGVVIFNRGLSSQTYLYKVISKYVHVGLKGLNFEPTTYDISGQACRDSA